MHNCAWALANDKLRVYHDTEWGVPQHDDRLLFEYLMLEVLQCGLNWNMMLQKRDVFHACLDGFDFDRIACYGEEDVRRILDTPGMLRSRRKVEAIINNARCYQAVRAEFGSFDQYLWGFTGGKAIIYHGHPKGHMPTRNGLSGRISADLRRRGFKYIGPVTIYSYLQSCGVINDHGKDCPRFTEVQQYQPVIRLSPEEEDLQCP